MAEQLFEVSVGLSLDNAVQMLYGAGAPGNTPETDAAPVGSSYNDTVDGSKWQKIANINDTTGWIELAGKDAAIVVEHISSTGVILDQVPTQKATEFAWMVTAVNEGDLTNKYSTLVHMSHNGTDTQDATNVTFDQSSILRQGAKIAGLQITGTLTGQGATQMMNLHVSSQTTVTFVAYRMVKNIAGSKAVVLGGANLSNHVADGSVHLMPWQNTLLDGLNQSLTSTQLNSLLAIRSNVQLQIDSKADDAATTAALATKADASTVTAALATKQASLGYTAENTANKGIANGYPTLDASGKVPTAQLPAYPSVPTTISSFTNDSSYQTLTQVNTLIAAATPSWSSLTGKPTFATVATSGSYTDLSNKPTLISSFTNDSSYQTLTQVNTLISAATPSWSSLTGKPTFATVATSGSYLDLSGKPTVVSAFTNDAGYQNSTQVSAAITAAAYTLPQASATVLGGVKVGAGLSITNGVLAATYTLPTASDTVLGGVKVDNVTITNDNGLISIPTASTSNLGLVKVDGTSIVISNGVLSATGSTAGITVWTGTPYDLGFSIYGMPASSEPVYRFMTTRAFTVPANFSGSLAKSAVAATASTVFSVKKNGTQFGTVTFTAGSSTGVFSTQAAVSFTSGDRISVVAPVNSDATLADIDITINTTLV